MTQSNPICPSGKAGRRLTCGQARHSQSGCAPISITLSESLEHGNGGEHALSVWLPPWVQRARDWARVLEHRSGAGAVRIQLFGEHELADMVAALDDLLDRRRLGLPCAREGRR